MTNQMTLYPDISAYETAILPLQSPHTMAYTISGNPNGVPVIVLHGGPGGGSSPSTRCFFDPKHYKIIQYDQRGCGASTPLGCLDNNTTEDLVQDINTLMNHLEHDQFHVFGGSWGSTLALAYAQDNPDRCLSLTLRGLFTMRQSEIDWFMTGMGLFFPEAFEDFKSLFPHTEKENLLHVFYNALIGDDIALRQKAALAWSRFESSCCALIPNQAMIDSCNDADFAYGISLMEAHYFIHNRFTPDDKLIQNIDKIRHIPAVLVQGRYDVVCPPITAYEIHKRWPEAEFHIIPDAGHSSREPGIAKALLAATERFKTIA